MGFTQAQVYLRARMVDRERSYAVSESCTEEPHARGSSPGRQSAANFRQPGDGLGLRMASPVPPKCGRSIAMPGTIRSRPRCGHVCRPTCRGGLLVRCAGARKSRCFSLRGKRRRKEKENKTGLLSDRDPNFSQKERRSLSQKPAATSAGKFLEGTAARRGRALRRPCCRAGVRRATGRRPQKMRGRPTARHRTAR